MPDKSISTSTGSSELMMLLFLKHIKAKELNI